MNFSTTLLSSTTYDIYRRLNGMFQAGMERSRNVDNHSGADREYIYSSRTYKTYQNEAKRFAMWCMRTHLEVRHLKDCKKFVNEYLESQIESNKSAWTLSTQKAALAKLFGVDYASFIATPPRERKNIKRSRSSVLGTKKSHPRLSDSFLLYHQQQDSEGVNCRISQVMLFSLIQQLTNISAYHPRNQRWKNS